MTKLTYAIGAVAVLLMTALAAACGGTESAMRATLTDDGCAYEGDTTPAPGVFTVEVENETMAVANFALHELAEGAELEEIEPLYARARREYERTGTLPWQSPRYKGPLPWPPQFKRPVSNTMVGPEATGELPINEVTGRYVVLCEVLPNEASESPDFPLHDYAAVELDVAPKG